MKPIYKPKGKAGEYAEWALNIYTGCPHRCPFCYVPNVLRKDRELFHSDVRPRKDIVTETKRQIEREGIAGRLVHLCFSCDPYPTGYDTTPTRDIIRLLKDSGNHVQILTKGIETRDFDLLDKDDWFGVTITGAESAERIKALTDVLRGAKQHGISTWISFEPVLYPMKCLMALNISGDAVDRVKVGKLNYMEPPCAFSMAEFLDTFEGMCRDLCVECYVKEDTRKYAEQERKGHGRQG